MAAFLLLFQQTFAFPETFPTFALAYKILILLSIFSAGKVYFPRKNR